MNKEKIRFGMVAGSVGDAVTMTGVVKNYPFIIEVKKDCDGAKRRASVFKNLCEFEYVENPIFQNDSFAKYKKHNPNQFNSSHQTIQILNIYGIQFECALPTIILDKEEEVEAEVFLKQFSNKPCIVVQYIKSGFSQNCQISKGMQLPEEILKNFLNELSKKYNVLHITLPTHHVDYEGVIPIFDKDVRQTAAIIKKCGLFWGVDSGFHHISVAVKAKTIISVPTFSSINGYTFSNYAYTKDSFPNVKDVDYILFGGELEFFNNL
jgi:glutaredoxin-related protein